MRPERNESIKWSDAVLPVVNIARRIETNPPHKLLVRSIVGLLAVNATVVGIGKVHDDDPAIAITSEAVQSCEIGCDAITPVVKVLPSPAHVKPKALRPSPSTIKLPSPHKTKEPAREKRIRREPLREWLEGKIDRAPTLEDLARQLPDHYVDWREQLAYIAYLDEQANVSVQDYKLFEFNDTYRGAFSSQSSYDIEITPQLIVPHWTVDRYKPGLAGGKQFSDSLIKKNFSSNYMVSHTSNDVFRFFDRDNRMSAGGLGLNDKAIHIEIEAGLPSPHATDPTVIYDITPEQVERTVMTIVRLARRYDLAISKYTVVEHLRADLMFVNKTYNSRKGTFENLRKFDVAPDLTNVFIKKADILDRQLG